MGTTFYERAGMIDSKPPYTPQQLSERWQCSVPTIHQLIARGDLRSFRVGKMYRIPFRVVEEYEATSVNTALEPQEALQGDVSTISLRTSRAQSAAKKLKELKKKP